MIIDSTGVGIGVTPILPLHVKGSQEQLTISEGATRGATFDYRSSTGNLNISTNGANARSAPQFTLDLNGNVGIGTATIANESDHKKLKISGASGTGAGIIEFADGSNNIDGAIFSDDGHLFIVADRDDATADSTIRFRVDGSSEKMRLTSAGNLGLGTSSPSYNMEIFGSVNTFLQISQAGDAVAGHLIGRASSKNLRIQNSENADIGLWTNNTERVLIDSIGDVTINSSTTGVGRLGHYVNQYVTLADDASIQIQSGAVGMFQVHLYERGSGAGAIFHCNYDGTTALVNQFVAGGNGFSTGDSDGYYCLFKNDNAHVVTFKNRNGTSRTFHIMIIGAEV
jgi:hypothetical protein